MSASANRPLACAAANTYELLTSPGPAAIAVMRVRGPAASAFLGAHVRLRGRPGEMVWRPGDVRRAELLDGDGSRLDDILVSVHARSPQWDLRLHLHGSPSLLRRCAALLEAAGLVPAQDPAPGLWPGCDVLQSEAYALLPRMPTSRGAHWLLQQPGRLRARLNALLACESFDEARQTCQQLASRLQVVDWFTKSARIVLVGPPNVGKSTLANALADQTVSIVSAEPGTTRDWVDVPGQADGFPVLWVDTAGLRRPTETVEALAITRTYEQVERADALVVVLDATDPAAEARQTFLATGSGLQPDCVALNKTDLPCDLARVAQELPENWRPISVGISAISRAGLDAVIGLLVRTLGRNDALLLEPGAFTEQQARVFVEAAAAPNLQTLRALIHAYLSN